MLAFQSTVVCSILVLALSPLRLYSALWLEWSEYFGSNLTFGTFLVIILYLLNAFVDIHYPNMTKFCALISFSEKTHRNVFGAAELLSSLVLIWDEGTFFGLICNFQMFVIIFLLFFLLTFLMQPFHKAFLPRSSHWSISFWFLWFVVIGDIIWHHAKVLESLLVLVCDLDNAWGFGVHHAWRFPALLCLWALPPFLLCVGARWDQGWAS